MARCAGGAFGHGMPCPYWEEVRQNEIGVDVPGIAICAALMRWHRRHFQRPPAGGQVLLKSNGTGRMAARPS
jgi:hypothetical protein